MDCTHFEELPVWRKAIDLAVEVRLCGASSSLPVFGDLRDQIERASLSISNHIAEGFERGTRRELLNFLTIAQGSAAEVRSMLRLSKELVGTEGTRQLDRLLGLVLEVSRQLGSWIDSLKSTDASDSRERTLASRLATSEAQRRQAFARQFQRLAHGELGMHTLAEP